MKDRSRNFLLGESDERRIDVESYRLVFRQESQMLCRAAGDIKYRSNFGNVFPEQLAQLLGFASMILRSVNKIVVFGSFGKHGSRRIVLARTPEGNRRIPQLETLVFRWPGGDCAFDRMSGCCADRMDSARNA